MKKMHKALLALLLSITVTGTSVAPVSAATIQADASASQTTNDSAAKAAKLLADLKGDYVQLFQDAIFDAKYDKYWQDDAAAIVGESYAKDAVSAMKTSVGSNKYGAEAEQNAFCCKFINGVKEFSFQGDKIEITLTDGKKVSHTYKFLREDSLSGVMPGFVFQSTDKNEDEFKYFFLCGDTPGSTYHIEFRYGSDLDELLKMTTGKYANWLAAGILKSSLTEKNEATIQNVIALFCAENLADMKSTETSAQQKALAGIWDADMSAYANAPDYKNAKMYCVLKEDGTGETYVDMQGTGKFTKAHSFTFYAYDNDNNAATNTGVYIPVDEDGTVEAGKYALTQTGDSTLLSFETLDGSKITYVKRNVTLSLEKKKASLYVKGTTTVHATVTSGIGETTYVSSNPEVASVDADGNVIALKKGTTVITVSNSGVSSRFTVSVKNPSLNKKSVSMKIGKTCRLTVKGQIGKATYKSSNSKIAKVTSKGVIKAKKNGKAVITVKVNGVTLKCKVTVKKK